MLRTELGCDLGANDLEVGASVNIDELIGLDLCVTVDIDIPVLTGLDYGDTIDLDYAYDPVGNVKSQTRKDGSASAVSTTYGYDKLNRLTSSAGPASNTYKYDKAGNRTQWVTNKAPDTGKALTVNAAYNGAGQLVSESKKRPALLGSSTVNTSYTYDGNGNRTKTQTGLSSTTYKYTDDDKVAEVNQAGRKVTTGYDGIGRALTTTTQSLLILASTTTQVSDGYDVVQQSGPSGVSNLVRDVNGDVAIHTADGLLSGGDRWGLTDRLGSTIAQTSGSRVGLLAKYSDWGIPSFASVGFNSRTGYTGELSDTTAGLNHYYARSYEPTSGSWLTADPYRGTLGDPGTLARYAYVEGNPATYQDLLGYRISDPGAYAVSSSKNKGGHVSPSGSGPRTPSGNQSMIPNTHGPTCGIAGRPGCGGFSLGGAVFDSVLGPFVGFARALGNTVLTIWDYSPIILIGQALFLGPSAALRTFQRQGMGFVSLAQSIARDPIGVPIRAVGEAFGGDQWASAPGQAAGTAAFTIASIGSGPVGAATRGTTISKSIAALEISAATPGSSLSFRSDVSHIFRTDPGHLAVDPPENRALLQSAVRPGNEYGEPVVTPQGAIVQQYRVTLPDGRQVWVKTLDGHTITNGGVNDPALP